MAKFWKSNEFKKLNDEWAELLKQTGFVDAEKEVNGEHVLVDPTSRFRSFDEAEEIFDQATMGAKADYFRMLYQKASQAVYEDDLDRLIMERTAEGKTIKQISDELKAQLPDDRKRSKFNRRTIRYVRRRYETKWGIKVWNPEQMISKPAKRRVIKS